MKKKTFKVNLKLKWVVGLVVVLSLGLGEFPTRSYVALIKEKFNKVKQHRSLRSLHKTRNHKSTVVGGGMI